MTNTPIEFPPDAPPATQGGAVAAEAEIRDKLVALPRVDANGNPLPDDAPAQTVDVTNTLTDPPPPAA